MDTRRSEELFARAKELLPGGVNSPVRAFKSVGGTPRFIARAQGAFLWDEDGNRYIDYVGSWGPMILGHADPDVVRGVQETAARGLSFGAPSALEVELAARVVEMVPSIEVVRFVNSGTEAVMSALRLARGYTRRPLVLKFEGGYHGHADGLLVKAGSGAATFGTPDSAGVPEDYARLTLTAPFNDEEAVARIFAEHGERIAAVIVEPVPGNTGVLDLMTTGFLPFLREITQRHGALLVFDEVMSGFRVAPGGAQERFGVMPDLTCLGKVIGGGMPVGAYGGPREIMRLVAPEGPVYQAGTLSGNPVAMRAGLETLGKLRDPEVYRVLERRTEALCAGLREAAKEAGVPVRVQSVGAMFTAFFTDRDEVRTHEDVRNCDLERFARFFHAMLERGVYLPPSQFEAAFVSLAHGDGEIERTIEAARAALAEIAQE